MTFSDHFFNLKNKVSHITKDVFEHIEFYCNVQHHCHYDTIYGLSSI